MFLEDFKDLTLDNELLKGFRYTCFQNKLIVIEDYKKLISYTIDKIEVKVKNNIIVINGKDLKITKIDNYQIFIKGEIFNVETK